MHSRLDVAEARSVRINEIVVDQIRRRSDHAKPVGKGIGNLGEELRFIRERVLQVVGCQIVKADVSFDKRRFRTEQVRNGNRGRFEVGSDLAISVHDLCALRLALRKLAC